MKAVLPLHWMAPKMPLNCILAAIEAAGYEPFKHITIGLDCASSEFIMTGIYDYTKFEGPQRGKAQCRRTGCLSGKIELGLPH